MTADSDCPSVVLASGQTVKLLSIMLYDEEGVQEVAKLRAQAAKSLGGGSLGVGVIGSPSWTLLGEAAAISIISGLLSSLSQKQAIEMLQSAQRKSEAVAKSGVFVDFAQVTNSQTPHPSGWSALVEIKKDYLGRRLHVHNGDEFVNVETDMGAISIRWGQVAAYCPPQQSAEKLLRTPQQSPEKLIERRSWTATGWGQLAGTDAPSRVGSSQVPPKVPSVNDELHLVLWTPA